MFTIFHVISVPPHSQHLFSCKLWFDLTCYLLIEYLPFIVLVLDAAQNPNPVQVPAEGNAAGVELPVMPHVPLFKEGNQCKISSCVVIGQSQKNRFSTLYMSNLCSFNAFLAGDTVTEYMENVVRNIPIPITKASVKWVLDQLPCNQPTARTLPSMVRHYYLAKLCFIVKIKLHDSMFKYDPICLS